MAEDAAQSALCGIAEQAIFDPASGFTISFWRTPAGESRLRIAGQSLELGNREFHFDADGQHIASGSWVEDPAPQRLRVFSPSALEDDCDADD